MEVLFYDKWTGNCIGDGGASKISESLMMNTTLSILNLNSVMQYEECSLWRIVGKKDELERKNWTVMNDKQGIELEILELVGLVIYYRKILHWLHWICLVWWNNEEVLPKE